ncbi:hypothetical protein MWU78_06835 [Arenibacter sp. F26102]|jgi:hypothetical protein|uniref:hypothetical protein n=1 Tax=Arenibacter sp. F26102 TaxID=2926416 RepID=UPI001FF1A93B|nr:hypothetical protein [Arenibacter sp. F26102]MCK0145351.1 hypothetical protein [Arenibacter sp. F26102]
MKGVRNSFNAICESFDGPVENSLLVAEEIPPCSFSGKPADFYIGLAGSGNNEEIRIIGAICREFVETAIVNVLGQGVDDIQWPVILDLNREIYYHSYDAHLQGYSAIMGWKELLRLQIQLL